jgi:glucose-6-phosphate isomerase
MKETIRLLLELARARGLQQRIAAMFAGEKINTTENRAVLHVALRNRSDRPILVDGQDVMPEVRASLAKMRNFVDGVHGGRVHGATGKTFTDIVNIGIGGSDLGIVMATEALANFRNHNLRLHCVSNIDGVQLGDVLEKADPARTLFVVCSKTFTTLETLSNAKLARQWIVDRLGEGAPARHFAAVSTNAKAMDTFLIPPQNRFTMWDWVGGRYSVWSAGRPVGRARARHGPVRADAGRRLGNGSALRQRAVRAEPAGADGPDRRVEPQLPRHGFARVLPY